jgi:hypothetical protein
MDKLAKSIMVSPERQVYIADFGREDDGCLVAEPKEKAGGVL